MAILLEYFKEVKDFRIERKRLYSLEEILLCGLVGTLAGCDDWIELVDFCNERIDFLREYLPYDNGIPSDDTFRRVFSHLDSKQFQECFTKWVCDIQEDIGVHIAIDGKTLRGSASSGKRPLHMVSAFSSEMRLVLGQCVTHEKSNEISAIPELLKIIALKDAVVTIDAMGCQKHIASDICEAGGHYILALKGNQKTLHRDVVDYFEDDVLTKDLEIFTTTSKEHGRIEERSIRKSSDISWLVDMHQGWSNLNTIIEIRSKRTVKEEATIEKRYYITDLKGENLENLLKFIRSHWSIENSLHWVLDVVFKEDYNQCHVKNEAQNLAILRHTALNLIRKNKSPKTSIKTTRKKASWSTQTLRNMLI